MAEKIEIPKDISPKDFFEKFVPELFGKTKDKLPEQAKALNALITFELTGDNGGSWTVHFDKGDLKISEGENPDRLVKIIQTVADWREGIEGRRGFRLEMPGAGSGKGMGMGRGAPITQEKLERLKDVDGIIMFRLTDPDMDPWVIAIKFGKSDKKDPDCTISMRSDDAKAMRKGELAPPMAFMSGKIDIKGDLGFAMQIGTNFMS